MKLTEYVTEGTASLSLNDMLWGIQSARTHLVTKPCSSFNDRRGVYFAISFALGGSVAAYYAQNIDAYCNA